jgi:hypothetical protein
VHVLERLDELAGLDVEVDPAGNLIGRTADARAEDVALAVDVLTGAVERLASRQD